MENHLVKVVQDNLYISTTDTVQPNILLRTSLFSAVSRRETGRVASDVTESFRGLEVFRVEGYESVKISGAQLNVQTDFKVWCGIVFAFSKYGYSSDTIEFSFVEFVKLCGYNSRRINSNLREQIKASLIRIQSQSVQFTRKDSKKLMATSLVLKASYDVDKDTVLLMADPDLWEVYRVDEQILISLKVLNKVPRSEVAQCLYLFLVSLPERPIPITLSRMRDRLNLGDVPNKEVNRSIKKAIQLLESIGYLKGSWTHFNGEAAYKIDVRDRNLLAYKEV